MFIRGHLAFPARQRVVGICYLIFRFRRAFQISVAILAVLVLLRPFDCFAAGFTRKAAACCVKGKCLPTANADECCKGTVPSASHLSTPKAPDQPTPIHAGIVADVPGPIAPSLVSFCYDEAQAPTGSPPSSRLSLPLLI